MEVNNISNKNVKTHILFVVLAMGFALVLCGSVSADTYVGGQPLTTVQNGTVSGGLYSDTYYGFNNSATPKNVTYNFKPLSSNAQVTKATLYTGVYLGNMQNDYPVDVSVTFNGNQIDSQHLNSTYTFPADGGSGDAVQINGHTNRITSDYLMWYDVTSQVKQNNSASVVVNPSNFDGRIKFISLTVAYNDEDSDKIMYWINQGHDVSSYNDEEYIGQTAFNGNLPGGSTVQNATLEVIHMASHDGIYTFNNNSLASSTPQGSYSGSDAWDVTGQYNISGANTLTYDKDVGTGLAGYYKIPLALLTVKYREASTAPVAAFNASPINGTAPLNVTFTDQSTGNVTSYAWDFNNDGTVDSTDKNPAYTYVTAGTYTVKLTVTGPGGSDDEVKTNYITVSGTGKPDLKLADLQLPSNPIVGTNYPVNVAVSNVGTGNAGSFVVKLYDNITPVGNVTIDSLAAGTNTTVTFNWRLTKHGPHILAAIADGNNQIKEIKEINNMIGKLVMVRLRL